jgi:hypothetical protein
MTTSSQFDDLQVGRSTLPALLNIQYVLDNLVPYPTNSIDRQHVETALNDIKQLVHVAERKVDQAEGFI